MLHFIEKKVSGAFLFVDFLHRNGCLLSHTGQPVINDTGLAALTLLVAESEAKPKILLLKAVSKYQKKFTRVRGNKNHGARKIFVLNV